MKVKQLLALLTLGAAVTLTALSPAGATPRSASLVIRHQVRGCHTWALNAGAFRAKQTVTLTRGASLTIVNNDVMPHALVKIAGPSVRIVNLDTGKMGAGMGIHGKAAPGAMSHMGASTKVVFGARGVYRFVTKAGEDYMPGMKTVGEDNVLRLTVTIV
jgi:hypothetical protein